jgi:chorismate mutase
VIRTRAIRGATTVESDTTENIINRTQELLLALKEKNDTDGSEVASIFFTMTDDLHACFPAVAARKLGWQDIPLMCGKELNITGGMKKVIRVLIHINTELGRNEMKHVYLHGTEKLREDLKQD